MTKIFATDLSLAKRWYGVAEALARKTVYNRAVLTSSENIRNIVIDSDGRVTALLESAEESNFHDEISVATLPLKVGDRLLFALSEQAAKPAGVVAAEVSVGIGVVRLIQRLRKNIPPVASPDLMKHAIETFGSEAVAMTWFLTECGALDNRTPAAYIKNAGNEAEVERILGCIDYGMIA